MKANREISNAFNAHAGDYEHAAKVQHEIGSRLFARLDYLKITPNMILDLGCGPGHFTMQLKKRYPKACVVGMDIAYQMLLHAKARQRWHKKCTLVQADMLALPFQDGLFDLVFSNQVIHWSPSIENLFHDLNRIMKPGGCLMFSTLGPDTFLELRQAFKTIDTFGHVNDFLDMHDVGDHLLRARFEDPVVDMDNIKALYPSLLNLLKTLKMQGVKNIHPARNPGLTGKASWQSFEQNMKSFQTTEQKYPLTYEVVYGHAWKGTLRQTERGVEAYFPLNQLKVRT